jgi:hypothetical protein
MSDLQIWKTPFIQTVLLALMIHVMLQHTDSWTIAGVGFITCLWVISVVIAAIEETKQ